jgi:hypothetical protein
MQSSVNQIASAYRGNPAPLQQRVNQDKQANQGIPADLKELLALHILTEERDSASRQKAIQQLQQTGQQPTVAQSLQQRAKQAIQAKAVQEQQNQQGLQGLMQQLGSGAVPENVPQPQRQPQGIDQLPTGMDEFSGGGIVAFAEGGETDAYETSYDRMNRKNREEDQGPRVITLPEGTSQQEASLVQMQNPDATVEVEGSGSFFRDAKESIKKALTYSSDVEAAKARQAAPSASNRRLLNNADAAMRSAPPVVAASAPPERKAPPVIASPERKAPPAISADKPVISAAPAAGGLGELITPDVRKQRQQLMIDAMNRDPATEERLRREAYEQQVGAPQTAGLEQLARELQERRLKMQERNRNIDPLVERLSAIANAPRGQKWMYSMLAGNAAVDKARDARETQDFDMLKQIVEQQNKIEDVKRGYRAETFAIGDKERNRVYKDAFEAAKELGADDREAEKLAQEAVLRREQMANSLKVSQINASRENQAEARNKKFLDLRNRARVLRDAGKIAEADRLEAQAADIMAISGKAGSSAERGATPTDRLRAAQSILEDIDSTPAEKAAARIEITNIMSGMKSGTGASSAASGKVPPPPPGFKLN